MSNEYSLKVRALAAHLNVNPATITEPSDDEQAFECENEPGEWLVLTDSEADDAFDRSLDSYIDDCILHEVPEAYRSYFDSAAWKRDVRISDGRGPSLATYDGQENEEKIEGEWFHIYRVN